MIISPAGPSDPPAVPSIRPNPSQTAVRDARSRSAPPVPPSLKPPAGTHTKATHPTAGRPTRREDIEKVTRSLTLWKRSLLDLSHRNRLIDFQGGKATRIQIARPHLEDLYTALTAEGGRLSFPHVRGQSLEDLVDSPGPSGRVVAGDLAITPPVETAPSVRDLYRRLERLRRGTRTIFEEQGVHTLFLALGLLDWSEADETLVHLQSPLLLVPVQLQKEDTHYVLLSHEDDAEVNPALVYKLNRDFGLELPLLEIDEDGSDPGEVFKSYMDQVRHIASRRDWKVLDQAWLAQFAFYKLPMYRDLEAPGVAERAAAHPILSTICGVGGDSDSPAVSIDPAQAEQDQARPEAFPVADADSSQIEVVERVRLGHTLVVQGPPGTGKSQTIVNLISQALRDGKTVLFVSEKRAALDVVYTRLQHLGLADLCLDLHSARASRKTVIEDLAASLQVLTTLRPSVNSGSFNEYNQLRSNLQHYVTELHRPRDRQGRSTFQVHGQLARLHSIPLVMAPLPFENALNVESSRESEILDVLHRIASLGVWDAEETHPWRQITPPLDFVAIPDAVAVAGSALARAAGALITAAAQIRDLYGTEQETAADIQARLDLLRLLATNPAVAILPAWLDLDPKARQSLLDFARRVQDHLKKRAESRTYLRGLGMHTLPDTSAIDALYDVALTAEKAPWIRRVVLQARLGGLLRPYVGRRLSRLESTAAVRALRTVQEADLWLATVRDQILTELGVALGTDTWDLTPTLHAIEWLVRVAELAGEPIPQPLRQALLMGAPERLRHEASTLSQAIMTALEQLRSAVNGPALVKLFGDQPPAVVLGDLPLHQLQNTASVWQN
ncbi:MAG: DUF4011 domain-containing protein, partial [Chloroflexi bacterium]|nr:DUF4011 domain-containing protein [Chloroflexota bacterium]